MASDEHPDAAWRTYAQAAARLRLDVARNMDDFVYGAGGRIVYVFDAGVVRLFLDPTHASQDVRHFPGESESDLAVSAVVTSEFLFSRTLAGQHGAAPLISPGHAEDLAVIVDRLAGRTAQGGMRPDGAEAMAAPDAASDVVRAAAEGGARFGRLMREEMLKPLSLHPDAVSGVLRPPKPLVDMWDRLIGRWRRSGRDGTSGASARNRRDAETIAQLIVLNHATADALVPTRFVLVTANAALTRAYDRWFGESGAPHSAYMLRRPQQYTPLLHVEEMAGVDGPGPLRQVRDVLDCLFDAAAQGEATYRRSLMEAATGRPPTVGRPRGPRGPEATLADLQRGWAYASRSAVLLSVPLIAPPSTSGGADAAAKRLRELLDETLLDLEAVHTGLVLGDVPDPSGTPCSLDPEVRLSLLGSPSSGSGPYDAIAAVARAADLAFRAGRWWSAARFARRARSAISHEERRAGDGRTGLDRLRFEMVYVEAAAGWRDALDARRFQEAKALLAEASRFHSALEDAFGSMRTLVEDARLRLTYVLARQVEGERWPPAQDADALLLILEASGALARACVAIDDAPEATGRAMRRPLDAALLGLGVYDRALLRFDLVEAARLADAIGRVKAEATAHALLADEMRYLATGLAPSRPDAGIDADRTETRARSRLLVRLSRLKVMREPRPSRSGGQRRPSVHHSGG